MSDEKVTAVDNAKGFISKKLVSLGGLATILMMPEVQMEIKVLFAKVVALYIGVQALVDAVKSFVKGWNERKA